MSCCGPEGFQPHPYADPDCDVCGGDGYVTNEDLLYLLMPEADASCTFKLCEAPGCIDESRRIAPAVFTDADRDGWLDNVRRVPAKYARGKWTEPVRGIVDHNLRNGRGADGPNYFANPCEKIDGEWQPRIVSAHFHIAWDGTLTQMVPLTRGAYHAGGLGNGWTIGIEHDALRDADAYSPALLDTHVRLIEALRASIPTITQVLSHRSLYPKTRRDPIKWPWGDLTATAYKGLQVRL